MNKGHPSRSALLGVNRGFGPGTAGTSRLAHQNSHEVQSERTLQSLGVPTKTIRKTTRSDRELIAHLSPLFSEWLCGQGLSTDPIPLPIPNQLSYRTIERRNLRPNPAKRHRSLTLTQQREQDGSCTVVELPEFRGTCSSSPLFFFVVIDKLNYKPNKQEIQVEIM